MEASAVMRARKGAGGEIALDARLERLGVTVQAPSVDAARLARLGYARFGRGVGDPGVDSHEQGELTGGAAGTQVARDSPTFSTVTATRAGADDAATSASATSVTLSSPDAVGEHPADMTVVDFPTPSTTSWDRAPAPLTPAGGTIRIFQRWKLFAAPTLILLGLALSACEPGPEPRQAEPAGLEPAVTSYGEAPQAPSTARMAVAAARHVYDGLVSGRPRFREAPIAFDPSYPVRGGPPLAHDPALVAAVAGAFDARLARRAELVRCPSGDPRNCRIEDGAVLIQVFEASVEGREGRVVVGLTYELPEVRPWTVYSFWSELFLELRGDTWEVVGIGMRGMT